MKKAAFFLLGLGLAIPIAAHADSQVINSGTQDDIAAFGRATALVSVANPFVFGSADNTLTGATFCLEAENGPSDGVYLELQGDAGGVPDDTPLDTSDTVSAATITTSFNDVSFTFTGAYTLVNGTTYWLVAKRSGSLDDTARYRVCGNTSGHPSVTAAFYDGPGGSWHASYSAAFNGEVQFGAPPVPPTPELSTSTVSTVDQAESNLGVAFGLFLASMYFMVWLLRKH